MVILRCDYFGRCVLLFSVVICLACLLVDLLPRRAHQFLADKVLLRPVEGMVTVFERIIK